MFDGSIHELLQLRERNDFIKLARDFLFPHAENCATEINVFAAGKFGVKACADFQKASDASVNFRPSLGRPGDP